MKFFRWVSSLRRRPSRRDLEDAFAAEQQAAMDQFNRAEDARGDAARHWAEAQGLRLQLAAVTKESVRHRDAFLYEQISAQDHFNRAEALLVEREELRAEMVNRDGKAQARIEELVESVTRWQNVARQASGDVEGLVDERDSLKAQLNETCDEFGKASSAIMEILGWGYDDRPEGSWPCGTMYYDAIGLYVDKLRQQIDKLNAELGDSRSDLGQFGGLVEKLIEFIWDMQAQGARVPNEPDLTEWDRKAITRDIGMLQSDSPIEYDPMKFKDERIDSLIEDLNDSEDHLEETQGLLDKIDIQIGEALEKIGKFPPKPAGFPDRIDVLCDVAVKGNAEIERLNKLIEILNDPKMTDLELEPGGVLRMRIVPNMAAKVMAISFAEMIAGAPNWASIHVGPFDSYEGRLIVTVQRATGDTPAETVTKLKTALGDLVACVGFRDPFWHEDDGRHPDIKPFADHRRALLKTIDSLLNPTKD